MRYYIAQNVSPERLGKISLRLSLDNYRIANRMNESPTMALKDLAKALTLGENRDILGFALDQRAFDSQQLRILEDYSDLIYDRMCEDEDIPEGYDGDNYED